MSMDLTTPEEAVVQVTGSTLDLEQYRSLRNEILRGTEDGNQVISYGLAAVGIVVTAAVTQGDKRLGFLLFAVLVPGLSSLVLSLWFGTLERIARASFFITGIESRLKMAAAAPTLPMWDSWLRAKDPATKKSNHHFWTTEYSGIALFFFFVVGPLLVSLQTGGATLRFRTKVVVVVVAACAELVFMWWMGRRVKNWRRWLSSMFAPGC
jgi:hypothetical protein